MKSKKTKNTSLTRNNQGEFIDPEFDDLFATSSQSNESKNEARMIMFRFLSEIERTSNQQRGLKKRLADAIGKSQSFITQLFNGDKLVNLSTLAKFQTAMGIKFKIIAFPTDKFDNNSVSEIVEILGNRHIKPIQNIVCINQD